MIRETYIILWRKQDGEVWNEAGEVDTLGEADSVSKKLRDASGLQVTSIFSVQTYDVKIQRRGV